MRQRLVGGVVRVAVGFGIAVLLDFEPQPLPYVVWSVVMLTLSWLVLDTIDAPVASWRSGPPTTSERTDEVTSDLRILTSHTQADHPSDALARRLVELARGRGGPALAADVRHELADRQRLSPADVDRILTRIEDSRDRR